MTTLHPIIAQHEEFQRIAAARADIAAATAANAKLVAVAQDEFDAKLAAWTEAANEGKDPGPRPELSGVLDPDVRRGFTNRNMSKKSALRDEEATALIMHADEFATQLAGVEATALGRAAAHVEALDALAAELGPVVETVKALRTATGDSTKTVDGPVDAAALVDAAHSGRRLLEPSIRTETIVAGGIRMTKRQAPKEEPAFTLRHGGKVYQSGQRAAREHERG